MDLDSAEAIACAKLLLPDTGMIHGRPGKPDSHFWYVCVGAKTSQFTDIKDTSGKTSMLVEIRSTGGYTAVPPSLHPSGEMLGWAIERIPTAIEWDALYDCLQDVAIAALLVRHWPRSGAIHVMIGPLAGFLLQAGLAPDRVRRIIDAAAEVAGADVKDVRNYVSATISKFEKGEKVTGGPKLTDCLPEAVVVRMRGWLKLADVDAIEQMNATHFWTHLGKDDVIGREDDADGVVFQRVRALYTEYANRQIAVGETDNRKPVLKRLFPTWLESPERRSYRGGVTFAPPPRKAHDNQYNLWKGFAVSPAEAQSGTFLEHLYEVICSRNDEHYRYLTKLCAYTLQYPGLPSEIATALRGKPGTGKGTFIRVFQRIFGRRHFAHLDRVKDLVEFNALISGKVVVFADEAFFAGDKREIGTLKRLITGGTG